MSKVMLGISFIFMLLGAAGIMNEAGSVQPVGVVMCLAGALGMLVIGRAFYFGE